MEQPFSRTLSVPVAGGDLHVGVAGPGGPGVSPEVSAGPAVVAVHGITGSHRSWNAVARNVSAERTFIAPDLRGRGGSGPLPGPYGMDRHVTDLVAVLDHMGLERVVAVGHSMGAYVVARLAASHPERVLATVLVDGGLPLPVPEGVDPDALLEAVLGPALARLTMTFSSADAYHDFWRAHPAFAGPRVWSHDIADYVDYDLTAAPGGDGLRSKVSEVAVRADGRDLLDSEASRRAFLAMVAPAVLIRAPRGLLDEADNPLLAKGVVDEALAARPDLTDVVVDDTNHYLIVLGEREAEVVAAQILAVAPGDTPERGPSA